MSNAVHDGSLRLPEALVSFSYDPFGSRIKKSSSAGPVKS